MAMNLLRTTSNEHGLNMEYPAKLPSDPIEKIAAKVSVLFFSAFPLQKTEPHIHKYHARTFKQTVPSGNLT
jgi:hypothetical protein